MVETKEPAGWNGGTARRSQEERMKEKRDGRMGGQWYPLLKHGIYQIKIYLSIYLPVFLSVCLSVCMSVCLSVHLSIYINLFSKLSSFKLFGKSFQIFVLLNAKLFL